MSQQVAKLSKLTHLDISRNGYSSMPMGCTWPSTLRYLNISRAKLTSITPCLPVTLEVLRRDPEDRTGRSKHPVYPLLSHVQVLDLSYNDLNRFTVPLPALRELHLSGNKLLRLPPGGRFPNLQTLTVQVRSICRCLRGSLSSPGVTPPRSPTVEHPEHLRPRGSPGVQAAPGPPSGSEQIRVLL